MLTNNEPLFFTSKTVKPKDRSQIVSIKTGIEKLDKKIIGLNKKEVTCLSGSSGSGKSSIVSQMMLDVVNVGKKVAVFSGELSENRVMDWLHLQAAGKYNTVSTSNEYYYYVRPDVKAQIDEWLEQQIFIYNNNNGNDITEVMNGIEDCISRKQVDLVILDNLMALDLSKLDREKLLQEKRFVINLMNFAKKGDVHILFVAHPKKTEGFIRKQDISGSSDLTQAPDNVFIVHRVNEDFKRLSRAFFGWKETHEIYGFDNVIEVCKNRDLGVMDCMLGLYYEKESKRFKCEQDEYKKYGWELNAPQDEFQLPFDV